MEKLIIKEDERGVKGAVNSKDEIIIPYRYSKIIELKSEVYVAHSLGIGFQFYTAKGRLKENQFYKPKGWLAEDLHIVDYRVDNEENLIAIKAGLDMPLKWMPLEVDFENNEINYISKGQWLIEDVSEQILDYVIFSHFGSKSVFSLKEKKIIFSTEHRFEILPQGFIVHPSLKNYGYVNFDGELILDYVWDEIEFFSECIRVTKDKWLNKDNTRYGIYSYTGECILECEFAQLDVCELNIAGSKKTVFKVSEKFEDGCGWAVLDLDGSTIFPGGDSSDISIHKEESTITVQKKNKVIMYKFDILNEKIKMIPIIIGDAIESGSEYGVDGVYFVKRKGKYGLYNQYGAEVIPVKYKAVAELIEELEG